MDSNYLEEPRTLFHLHNQEETGSILPEMKYSYTYPGLDLLDTSEPVSNDSRFVFVLIM